MDDLLEQLENLAEDDAIYSDQANVILRAIARIKELEEYEWMYKDLEK